MIISFYTRKVTRKLLPTPPRNGRQTKRKQHKHQWDEKGHRPLPHGEPNGGLPSYSSFFFSLGVQVTPVHKSALLHLWNVASRVEKLFFWKKRFSQLFRQQKACKDAKTPHFRAAFSVLHLSSTHLGPRWETRTPDILLPNFWIKIFLLFPVLYSRFCFIMDAIRNSWLHCFRTFHGCL